MTALVDYLKSLNVADSSWGLYVDPENIDDYRIGQNCFQNGGILDDKVRVASLDKVSCGHQSTLEAFENVAPKVMGRHEYNLEALFDAYEYGRLAPELKTRFDDEIKALLKEWADAEASHFVYEELPQILSEIQNSTY